MTSSRACCRRLAGAALAAVALSAAQAPGAIEVTRAVATREGAAYRVEVDARVNAPLINVRRLLTDYAHLGRINPSIEVSEILQQRGPGDLRVRTVTRVCVWFYCKRLHQVQDVIEGEDGAINARVIPELSDFRYGWAQARLWPQVEGTRVRIRGELEPDFWIPPLIGPWLVERKLVDEALVTINGLERVAPPAALPHNNAPLQTP